MGPNPRRDAGQADEVCADWYYGAFNRNVERTFAPQGSSLGNGTDEGSTPPQQQEAGISSASRGVTLLLVFSTLGDVVSWNERLDRPIDLPDGKTLLTLEDARRYILKLPKSELETVAWQVAIEALVIAAEKRDR
jgi:hypothetical protein